MLTKLPDELVVHILQHIFDIHDLLCVSLVCKQLHRLSNEDAVWRKFYSRRYFNSDIKPTTLKQSPLKTWKYLFLNQSRIENLRWEQSLPSVHPTSRMSTNSDTFEPPPSREEEEEEEHERVYRVGSADSNSNYLSWNRRSSLISKMQSPDSKSGHFARSLSLEDFTPKNRRISRKNLSIDLIDETIGKEEEEEEDKKGEIGLPEWEDHQHILKKKVTNFSRVVVKSQCLELTCMRFDSTNTVTGGGHSDIWDFEPAALLTPNNVVVYSQNSEKKVKTLTGHEDTITCIQIMGERILSSSKDKTLRIWKRNGPRWSKRTPFTMDVRRGHLKGVTTFHAEDNIIMSASKDKTVRIWDINSETGSDSMQTIPTSSIVYSLDFMKEDLVMGGKDRKVWYLDSETHQVKSIMKGNKGWISCLQLKYNHVMSGGNDGTLRLFDLRTGSNVRTIKTGNSIFSVGWITCLQWDENKVICGSADKSIRILDIVSGRCINTLKGHQDAVTAIQYDDKKLLSSSLDRTVRMWNFSGETNTETGTYSPHQNTNCLIS